MKALKLIALSILLLTGCSALKQPELVSELEFKDGQFAKCMQQQAEKTLTQVTEINCNNFQISAVDEIQYMPALTDIVLLKNNITKIDISKQPKLKRLILSGNQLTSIDLSANQALTSLNISNNQLDRLDISHNPKLKSIYAYDMPLASIDVTRQTKLKDLGLSRHKLTAINLANNPELRSLNLSAGDLTQIDLASNPKLSHLYLSSNKITALDIRNNKKLKVLNVRNNRLSNLDLSNNPELNKFKADYNQLTTLDFTYNPKLIELVLNNNQLTTLDLSKQLKLNKLTAFNNPLQSLTLFDEKSMALLSIEGTPYTQVKSPSTNTNNISNLLSPRVSIIEGGVISKEGKQYNIFATQMVTPSLGQYIGFRYAVTLPENNTKLTKQNQFPITLRMTHPKIVDPKTGKGFTVSSWADTMFKHNNNLAMWYFADQYELVTGRWTLELIYRGSVLAKKSFMLVNMDEKPVLDSKQAETTKQGEMMHKLITQGEKILCSQSKFRHCLNFTSFKSCTESLTPFKEHCQNAALASSNQKPTKNKSAKQLKKFFADYIACMSLSHIKAANLSAQQTGACFSQQ